MSLDGRGAHCEVGAGVACPQGGLRETPVDKGPLGEGQTKSGGDEAGAGAHPSGPSATGMGAACSERTGWGGVRVVSPAGIEPAFKV